MTPSPGRRRGSKETSKSSPETSTEGQTAADEAAAAPRKRKPRSIYIDEELLERTRAAVTELSAYQPEAGIRSLSVIFEPGGWAEVKRLEAKYNNGKPFRPVAKMPTGRPAGNE